MRSHRGGLQSSPRNRLHTWAGIAVLTVFSAGSLTPSPMRAQSSSGSSDRLKFDVASVKVNKNMGSGKVNLTQPGGHLTASNVSLKFLIIQAYQMERVHFGPTPVGADWIDSEHFDVEAEVEGNPSVEQKRLMLQSLLADRFKLTMHHETRQLPEYALELLKAGKTGPQLQPHTDNTKCVDVPAGQPNPPIVPGVPVLAPCGGLRMINGDLVGQNVTMEKLSETLSVLVNRTVVDQAGLGGTFDLTLHFQIVPLNADASAPDASGAPSISTALRDQLGLKLEPQTGPVDVLVIDHVEEPSPN